MTAVHERPRAGQTMPTVPDAEHVLGDDPNVSIPTTALGTALPNVPAGCRHAYLTVETFDVRIRPTVGGAPTSANGLLVKAGSAFDLTADPTLFKLIGIGGTAIVNAWYLGGENT